MHFLENENHVGCGLLTAVTVKINLAKPLQSHSHVTTGGQPVGLSWCRAPSGAHDQIFIYFCESYHPVNMGRPL
jgi:hypothetical protein